MTEILFPFEVRPSSLVVFEGLDNAGKSTIHQKLKEAAHPEGEDDEALFAEPAPYFTHQPSGGTSYVGRKIYRMTERYGPELNPKARQMLHLASHFQHYDTDIIPRLEGGQAVFMDRNYWSTFAYGYFGEGGFCEDMAEDDFYQFVTLPLRSYVPDLVFFFQHVRSPDHHNTPEVVKGYQYLVETERIHTVVVPDLSIDETVMFVFKTLRERGITKVWRS